MKYTQNRELSWLRFNYRVLEEAQDLTVPLLERMKFVAIFTSNLDEFFMIRVGSLYDMVMMGDDSKDSRSGMTPIEQLNAIYEAVAPLYKERDRTYNIIKQQLHPYGVCGLSFKELESTEKKYVKKYFKDTYNRDTIFIPNGVNEPEIKDAHVIKEKWNLEKESYILFLARIVPEKGLHYLIEAFKQIDTNKKLVIAGGASHTNDYFQEIKRKSEEDNRIIMTGFVQGQELEELFSNCCLYCLPSDVEGMPISLLEAMSYGCNCLVSDIEENKQVVEEYATTFSKGNVQDLKEKLEECLKKKKNSDTIKEYILKKYDWDEVTKRTRELYEK